MQSDVRNTTCIPMLLLLLLAVPTGFAQDWKPGDVFLGIAGGKVEVFRPSSGVVIETLSDGVSTPGPVNSSFIDNTWHLWTSNPGASFNQSKIARFTILPPQTVLRTIDGGVSCSGVTSSNIQSITIDGKGDLFAANANPPSILEFDPTGTCVAALALPVTDIRSIDLSTDGSTLWFTSSSNIGQVSLPLAPSSVVSTLRLSPNIPGNVRFSDLRVVAGSALSATCNGVACPTDDSLLVVVQGSTSFCSGAGSCVLLVDTSTGNIVTKYTIPGQNGLQSLTLDPIVQICTGPSFSSCPPATLGAFWVAPASSQFFKVSVGSGSSTTYSAGSGVVVSSLFVYSGFGANESIPAEFHDTLRPYGTTATGVPMTTSASFNFPSGTDANSLTATLYGTPGGTPLVTTNLTAFASTIDQRGGANDAGQPCTVTVVPGKCIDWEVETTPTPMSDDQLLDLQMLAPIGIDNNSRMFRDEATDVTISLDNTSGSRNSLYSLNEITGTDEGCAYIPSTQFFNGAVLNPNRNSITFRFQCNGLPGNQLAQLAPRISVTQLIDRQSPAPYFPEVATLVGGTCCTVADYRYDTSSNTWVLNVSFKGVPAGTEFDATTFDDNHIASAFHIYFFLGTSTK